MGLDLSRESLYHMGVMFGYMFYRMKRYVVLLDDEKCHLGSQREEVKDRL